MADYINDLDPYYQRRERQERELARAAMSPSIRDIHLQMAQHYAVMTRTGEPQERRAMFTVVPC